MGLGQFADLKGDLARKKGGVFGQVSYPEMHTMVALLL